MRGAAWATIVALAASACGSSTPPQPGATTASGMTHERGRVVYNARCYFCHGYSGDAKTVTATFLDPPPRDFTADPALTRQAIAAMVRSGRDGTAMRPFADVLTRDDIDAVAAFVEREFVVQRAANTRYHTPQNGWPDHERYAAAFPFARGEIGVDRPAEALDDAQAGGKRLFMSACVSCHDRARTTAPGPAWQTRPLSSPRSEYTGDPQARPDDDELGPYRLHDTPPALARLSPLERRGSRVYRDNCALCHAADGSGKSWVGSFIEPHPPDFATIGDRDATTTRPLIDVIENGIAQSAMPAFSGVLSISDIAAVAAYVQRAFGYAGATTRGARSGNADRRLTAASEDDSR